MIEKVVSVQLPVDEEFRVQKVRLTPPGAKDLSALPRFCLVTGTHGDELEGQYVAYELRRRIEAQAHLLTGIVDIYPALNPLGIDSITRGVPGFDLDMNRIFPGSPEGTLTEFAAHRIVEDIRGASCCVDVHASNIYLREIPQVRVNVQTADRLVPMAEQLNCDFIWVHASATVLESTLAYTLNALDVPTLVVEMGVGMRITQAYTEQLLIGLFNIMKSLGIWQGETAPVRQPIISTDGKVAFLNAEKDGMFVPQATHWNNVVKGEHIGTIINPLTGETTPVCSPCNGQLFTLREYPLVYEGSLIGRILNMEEDPA